MLQLPADGTLCERLPESSGGDGRDGSGSGKRDASVLQLQSAWTLRARVHGRSAAAGGKRRTDPGVEGSCVREDGTMIRESDQAQPSPPCTTAHAKGGDGREGGAVFTGGAWSRVPQQLEVQGRVNGFAEQILLDTGASMCLTSPRLFTESSPGLERYIEENLRPTK